MWLLGGAQRFGAAMPAFFDEALAPRQKNLSLA